MRPSRGNNIVEGAGGTVLAWDEVRGRHGFHDQVVLRLVYRHGLRAAEACGFLWSQMDGLAILTKRIAASSEPAVTAAISLCHSSSSVSGQSLSE